MSDISLATVISLPWALRPAGRLLGSAAVGLVAALTTSVLPDATRAVLGLDFFLLTFVVLTYVLTSVSSGEKCALMAKQMPKVHTGLIALIVTSLVGITTIAVLLHSQKSYAGWVRTLHLSASLLALLLGWVSAQMVFGIQYMRIYYRDLESAGSTGSGADLTFPGQSSPDLWDFMYYSFTIAMCFQTSDVSIGSATIRRLTLMHAIYSFFFVSMIIGFVINVLSALE